MRPIASHASDIKTARLAAPGQVREHKHGLVVELTLLVGHGTKPRTRSPAA